MNFSIIGNSVIFCQSAMILTIRYLEHDRNAGYTATFTRMFTPKPSACVPNMVIGGARSPRYMKFGIEF